jgi:hypothetical protein
LLKELSSNAPLLLQRQLELARLEAQKDLGRAKVMAGLLGSAGALAYAALVVLLVAGAQGIGVALDGKNWAGSLILAAALLIPAAILGGIGWAKRLKRPLPHTREELRKVITWARERTT